MGTKERRQRQFAEREQLFLDAARRLIEENGLLPLQMTRIAEAAEYAVGTLYQHFASKEDLLLALTTEGVREHGALFARVRDWDAAPRDRIMALAVADMVFVRRNPQYFRIAQYVFCEAVWGSTSAARREALMEANAPLSEIVVGIIEEAVARGDLDIGDMAPTELSTGLWAMALGTHDLVHAEGLLADFDVHEPYPLMCQHFQALLNGYGWEPRVSTLDKAALRALIARIKTEVFHDLCDHH
ncbi:TetR/AcrR family transcriptional regulator [Algiphilus sp.]|uniref:TetR/AcrR family transcriptional regulator n=1 Tax=Algiphilus sp. TaxID=1872431 RepID=UPI0025B7BAC6|nr:TetR/AcrR family transcriptional regulator [Algiphilus sp.]MCK5770661.1 TetR/AcrR family transcriptional regulator [Algiphilus sp.]